MSLVPVMAGLGPVAGFLAMAAADPGDLPARAQPHLPAPRALAGAALAGLLIELVTLLFPLYAKLAHGFDTYGQSLALFFLLATWLAFLSQFILIGAVWNRVRLGEKFTASGLLASGARRPPPLPPGLHCLIRPRLRPRCGGGEPRDARGDDRITGGVAASPHPSPRRSHRPEPDP